MTESKFSSSQLLKLIKHTFNSYFFTFSSLREGNHSESVNSFIIEQSSSHNNTEMSFFRDLDSMNIS